MIKLNWIFNGFRWSDKDKKFDSKFCQLNKRKNYHVLFYNNTWCVHSEGTKEIKKFSDKDSAVIYAKERAQTEKTEAVIHNEKNIIETSWIYDYKAFPQEKIYSKDQYPIESHPGNKVL